MQRTGGDANGFSMPWQSQVFEWSLPTTNADLTGSLSINRTGAGLTYAGFESHAQTLLAYGAVAKQYDWAPNEAGFPGMGIAALHFISEGENSYRGVIDDSPPLTSSTTTYQFTFASGHGAPASTVISLFDPGLAETNGPTITRGPMSYQFTATLNGAPVSTSDWTLHVVDPYSPTGNSDTTHIWNNVLGMLEVNSYTNALGADFPDNIAFVQTGASSFDSLTISIDSLASELIGIGLTSPFTIVPEPSVLLLSILSLGSIILNRRR